MDHLVSLWARRPPPVQVLTRIWEHTVLTAVLEWGNAWLEVLSGWDGEQRYLANVTVELTDLMTVFKNPNSWFYSPQNG